MKASLNRFAIGLIALCVIAPIRAAGSSYVDITWMSIANVYYELGPPHILPGARIVGPKTTCFQAMAQGIPADRCTAVYGGERHRSA